MLHGRITFDQHTVTQCRSSVSHNHTVTCALCHMVIASADVRPDLQGYYWPTLVKPHAMVATGAARFTLIKISPPLVRMSQPAVQWLAFQKQDRRGHVLRSERSPRVEGFVKKNGEALHEAVSAPGYHTVGMLRASTKEGTTTGNGSQCKDLVANITDQMGR